jgi:hypothetical protein
MFEEGLARFASESYSNSISEMGNRFIHLTNYSVNKTNENLPCATGIKWKMSDLRRYLSKEMDVDDNQLFRKIEDLLVKTILAGEPALFNGVAMFVPNR